MSERTRWGKAGQRLSPGVKALKARASGGYDHEAYRAWRAGKLVPDRITSALDLRGLSGPQVDLDCRAQEPEVDQWEEGKRYPRWDQVVALAQLTDFPLRFFTVNPTQDRIPVWMTSLWFTMTGEERLEAVNSWRPPVMSYPQWVIDAARLSGAPEEMPTNPLETP